MKISLVQFRALLGQVDTNFQRIQEFIGLASKEGSQIVVFPEVSDTGYEMSTVCKFAHSWESSQHLSLLKESARKYSINVVVGLTERVGTDVYNAVAVIDPLGKLIGHYRKIHLFSAAPTHEERFLKPGSHITLFKVGELTCGMMVCSDLQYPELARLYAINNVQLLLVPSAWCVADAYHWKTLLAARAIENQIYVAGINRVGTDDSVTFCGSSQILDPAGTVLISASEAEEKLITTDLTLGRINTNRSSFFKLQGRRPELYKGL